jgi:hypothetical protein
MFLKVKMIYNFLAVLEYQSPAVAFVVTLVKTVAFRTLQITILLIVARVQVPSVNEVSVVSLTPMNKFSTRDAPSITACIRIPQANKF